MGVIANLLLNVLPRPQPLPSSLLPLCHDVMLFLNVLLGPQSLPPSLFPFCHDVILFLNVLLGPKLFLLFCSLSVMT